MRVISGSCRSMPLICPKGEGTRPTTDRIKETLFNILQCDVPGSVFVDLFAGSGSIAIEALSRGAKYAYIVDNSKEAIECIKQNVNFTKLSDRATIIARSAIDSLYEINVPADIIFMDPPYGADVEEDVLAALSNARCLTEDTLIIIEADINKDFDFVTGLGYEVTREKCYKTNKHVFIRRSQEE